MTTTTSNTNQLTNTPQAGDDYYGWTEDQLLASTLLASNTNVVRMEVMANDLGGSAKKLWSIDDGNGNTSVADYDLVKSDMQGVWENAAVNNLGVADQITISNGAILLDLSKSLAYFGAADVNGLAAGDHIHDEFVYAIRLANGALSQAKVTVDIWGQNDTATISGDTSGHLTEDVTTAATGRLTVIDPDHGQSHTVATSGAGANNLGNYTVDVDGHWSYTVNNAAVQHLSTSETATDSFIVTSLDGTASQVVTITVTGTNDAPVAVADTGSATEDAAVLTGSVATNDSDVDDGATLSYALDAAVAGLTLNPNGSYSFDPSNAAYQHLAQGATTNVVAHYTVTDEHGAHDSSTLTITVTGTNDAPVAVADTGSATEDAAVLTGSVATNDSDVDDGATLSYALDAAVAGLTLNPNGSYSFDPSNAAYQHLAQGATTNVVAHYTVTDEHGAHDSSTLTITVTGTNDAPVAVADTGSATEDAAVLTGSVATNDSDVDDGATLSYALDAAVAGLTLNPNGSYSFDPSNAAYQHLAQGATTNVVAHYTVTDEHGAHDSSTLTITVTGTNDAPVAVADTGSATEDAAVLTGSVATNDSDVDDGATLSYALDAAVAGLTLNPNGSYSFDPSNAAYQHLAQGATTNVVAHYTVTDEHGAHDSSTLTITVTGTNDAPVAVADTGSATEDAAVLTGSVATNDSDVDDGATLSYALDAAVAGLTLNPNGSYSFDPSNAAYQHLAQGATTNVVAHYTVTDEHGAHDSSTLTITVTGTNDAPVAVADTGSATEDAAVLTGSVATNDSDVDDGATLSYALDAAVAGLTLNPNGSYSFDPSNAAYQHLAQGATTNVVAHYTVTDEHGAHDSSTLTITVTGTNDAPVAVADTGSATEDAAVLTGWVATNYSDRDAAAPLSYALDAAVAGLTLNPNGSYSFDPSNAAYQHLAQGATT